MNNMREILQSRWNALIRSLRRDPDGREEQRCGALFIEAWLEPHRRYHGPAHLLALLDRLESWSERAEDPPLLQLTAFAHDAVYNCEPGKDERESALLAEQCGVALGLSSTRIEAMCRWIEATAGHGAQADNDGRLFLDADLEILASEPAAYDRYVQAIREEYASVPEDLFRSGRATAMRSFLERPILYQHPLTPPFWEAQARENIAREIEALTRG